MALKLAGEKDGYREKIEVLSYNPNLQNSGDLEAGTKTITATAEASGLGSADYSKSLTLAKPADARIVVSAIAARLRVTIDSFDTATILYCRVYVDQQDANHRLFDLSWSSTGEKLSVTTKTSGTIFNTIVDGAVHTYYFFFWVDQANNAVISACQLWVGVGVAGDRASGGEEALYVEHRGLISFGGYCTRAGTGSVELSGKLNTGASGGHFCWFAYTSSSGNFSFPTAGVPSLLMADRPAFAMEGHSVATDLWAFYGIVAVLRSEE